MINHMLSWTGIMLVAVALADSTRAQSAARRLPGSPWGKPLSPAMQRAYSFWSTQDDRANEFFTNFKYSPISGIGKEASGSRRDPSKIIRHNGQYYVWYTRRVTESMPMGLDKGTDTIPAVDWDLADIYDATSRNGFDWVEQGVAVFRSPKGRYGGRSLSTPDILVHRGKDEAERI